MVRFRIFKSLVLGGVFVFMNSSFGQARQPVMVPDSMASMGDSITAGAIANYKRQWAINPLITISLLSKLAASFLTESLSPFEIEKLSWASGIDPRHRMTSHAARLEFMSQKRKLRYFNAAVSGSESRDLLDQLEDIKDWSFEKNRGEFPEYITILIGPNDICASNADRMVTPDVFEQNIRATLDGIRRESPHTKVLLSTVPNIEQLRSVAKDARLMGIGPYARCEDFWRRTQLCPTLTTLDDPGERARVALRVQEFNAALYRIAGFHHTSYAQEKLRVAGGLYNAEFTADHLSLDCFHPNFDGQNLISEETWKATWWFADWRDHHAAAYQKHIANEKRKAQQRRQAGKRI